jgi:predicted PurR-regulated permease PerM
VGFAALIVPIVMEQLASLVQSGPAILDRAQQGNGLIAQLDQQFHLVDSLKHLESQLPSTAFAVAKSFTALLFVIITIFILTAYIGVALPQIRRGVARLLVREHREEFATILEQATTRIGGYLMRNAVVSVIAGVVTYAGLSLLHVPYALALSLWVGLTDLIPTVGAYLGAAPALVVAAFAGTGPLIGTIALFVIYQQIENSFIAPHVMKRAINISPALVLISVLVGGALFGAIGAILAVPVAAVIRIMLDELYVQDRVEEVKKADRQEKSERKRSGPRRPFAFRAPLQLMLCY